MKNDSFIIGGKTLSSRLFVGSGKYASNTMIPDILLASGSQAITVALRRIDMRANEENILSHIPKEAILMPNTSGARTADEAVRIARLARAAGCGNWIKIEVISDNRYLMPDNQETIKATEILAAEGFEVFPYMSPDLMAAKRMVDAGACAIMPLGAAKGLGLGDALPNQDEDIESYIARKTLDGLFYMIGEKEKALRSNPLGRVKSTFTTFRKYH